MPKIKRESRQFIVINEEKLIHEVQGRPILYDKALKGYRKPAIREGAWLEVASFLQSSGEFLVYLLAALKSNYITHESGYSDRFDCQLVCFGCV